MSQDATSMADPYDTDTPCVGIFWRIQTAGGPKLVSHVVSLADAEEYGDFLTHPTGHYEIWEGWRAAGIAAIKAMGLPLEIATSEYEESPRGRVVYDRRADHFIIYADRSLQKRLIIDDIKASFGISDQTCVVRSDSHYVSGAHLPS